MENRKTQQLKFEFEPNIDKTRNLDQNVNISSTNIVIKNRKDELKNPIRASIVFLNNKTSNLTKNKKKSINLDQQC